jgi:hypothetical protein
MRFKDLSEASLTKRVSLSSTVIGMTLNAENHYQY